MGSGLRLVVGLEGSRGQKTNDNETNDNEARKTKFKEPRTKWTKFKEPRKTGDKDEILELD